MSAELGLAIHLVSFGAFWMVGSILFDKIVPVYNSVCQFLPCFQDGIIAFEQMQMIWKWAIPVVFVVVAIANYALNKKNASQGNTEF
jgi:type II secretory pathway component PulF